MDVRTHPRRLYLFSICICLLLGTWRCSEQGFIFPTSLCWAETKTSSRDVTGANSPAEKTQALPTSFGKSDSGSSSKALSHKENRLTAITVDSVSEEQVTVKVSTLLAPKYGTILIPPAAFSAKSSGKGSDKKTWYFVINISETRNYINTSRQNGRRKGSAHIFKEAVSHSLLTRIRATQFKFNPPIARVVFDLTSPQTPKITAAEDGLLVVFQKPESVLLAQPGAEEKLVKKDISPAVGKTEKVNSLTAVNVNVANEQIAIALVFGHKPTYKSGLLTDKKNHKFYFYLNLRNTRSLVAGGKVFKQEIEDTQLTRVLVSQYRREPPMARIVFYLDKFIKPKIVFEKDKLLVKFPRAGTPFEPKSEGEKQKEEKRENQKTGKPENEKGSNQESEKVAKQEAEKPITSAAEQSNPSALKRAASKLTEIKIDDKANDNVTIQLILDGIPNYRTALIPSNQTETASFYINLLNTTIQDKTFEQDISAEPLKKVKAMQCRDNPPLARVIFNISEATKPDIEEKGYQLIVKFPRPKSQKTEAPEDGNQPAKVVLEDETESNDDSACDQSASETDDIEPRHIAEPPSPGTTNDTVQKDDSSSTQNGKGEQSETENTTVPDSSPPSEDKKQTSMIIDITAEVLPKETILNIDIEGEIELRQTTYVTHSIEPDLGDNTKRVTESLQPIFSLKLASTSASHLFQEGEGGISRKININQGIIHNVVLNISEGAEKNTEILVHLTEKVQYSVSNTDVRQLRRLVVKFENPPLEQLVSLSFDKEELSTVMLMLSQQYGANIVAGSDLSGTVSVHATNVPLKEALNQILQAEGYTYVQEPGGFLSVLKSEEVNETTAEKADSQPGKMVIRRVIELKYALATELVESLQKVIGTEGSIVAEKRTNALIVTDTKDSLLELERIIAQLDKESSFANADDNPNKDDNSDAKGEAANLKKRIIHLSYISPDEASAYIQPLLSANGELTIIASPGKSDKGASTNISSASQGAGAGGTDALSPSVALGGTIMVADTEEHLREIQEVIEQIDVPVPQVEIQAYIVEGTITNQDNLGIDWRMALNEGVSELSATLPFGGDFPALNLQVGNLSADDFIGVLKILSARTDTKVLSSPKIMTIGNRPATFTSGDQIPYTELSITQDADTIATTSFKDTGIILNVIANVKRDSRVSLTIDTEVSDVTGFTPSGQPRISQRKATTQILVKDNDTAVIGGLIMERSDETVSKVPILGDIPLLGRLFRTTNKKNIKSEVTVFITPRIVK